MELSQLTDELIRRVIAAEIASQASSSSAETVAGAAPSAVETPPLNISDDLVLRVRGEAEKVIRTKDHPIARDQWIGLSPFDVYFGEKTPTKLSPEAFVRSALYNVIAMDSADGQDPALTRRMPLPRGYKGRSHGRYRHKRGDRKNPPKEY